MEALGIYGRNKNDEALQLMKSVADLEGSTDKHPVAPAPIQPARKLLGDMLLELGEPAQALRVRGFAPSGT